MDSSIKINSVDIKCKFVDEMARPPTSDIVRVAATGFRDAVKAANVRAVKKARRISHGDARKISYKQKGQRLIEWQV